MELPIVLEVIMISCFGLSWPINNIKAFKARTAKGSSLFFMVFIIIGYSCGIAAKIIIGDWNWLRCVALAAYILNFVMVSIGVTVYFRNKHFDKLHLKEKTRSKD